MCLGAGQVLFRALVQPTVDLRGTRFHVKKRWQRNLFWGSKVLQYCIVVLYMFSRRRRSAEEVAECVRKKQTIHSSWTQHDEERHQHFQESSASLAESAQLWNDMLQYITALESHGSSKPATQTWKAYFEEGLGRDGIELPSDFALPGLPFQNVLVVISQRLGFLQNETKKHEKFCENARQRVQKRSLRNARKEERAEKRLEKLQNEDAAEAKRRDFEGSNIVCVVSKYYCITVCNMKFTVQYNIVCQSVMFVFSLGQEAKTSAFLYQEGCQGHEAEAPGPRPKGQVPV